MFSQFSSFGVPELDSTAMNSSEALSHFLRTIVRAREAAKMCTNRLIGMSTDRIPGKGDRILEEESRGDGSGNSVAAGRQSAGASPDGVGSRTGESFP